MIGILIFVLTITIATSLQPKKPQSPDDEIVKIVSKYVNKIPDMAPKYVLNKDLSKMISGYYNKKINTFPLYKISFKIDRKPVKIPWALGVPGNLTETESNDKYRYVKVGKLSKDTYRDKKLNITIRKRT